LHRLRTTVVSPGSWSSPFYSKLTKKGVSRYVDTGGAERDLDEIEAYIATDNPVAAIDTVLRVIDSLAHLGEHPEMGRAGRIAGTREWVIPKTPFIAAYRISGKAIQVLRVLHGARTWPKRL